MKSYTDISQSKKLAEILPLESADMCWLYITAQGKYVAMMHEEPNPHYLERMESYGIKDAAIRCWSLASLVAFLKNQDGCMSIRISNNDVTAFYYKYLSWKEITIKMEDAIDACVELIIKLKKNGLI